MVTGAQIRMARAALRMGVRDLAEAAQVSPNTVTRVEADQPANASTLAALRAALERAGIIFHGESTVTVSSEAERAVLSALRRDPAVTAVLTGPTVGNYQPDFIVHFGDGTVGVVEVKGAYETANLPALKPALKAVASELGGHPARLMVVFASDVPAGASDPDLEFHTIADGRLQRSA